MSASARSFAAASKARGKSSGRRTSRSCGLTPRARVVDPFRIYFDVKVAETRDIPARATEAGDEASSDRIANGRHDDRNGSTRPLRRQGRWRPPRENQIDLQANQLVCQFQEPFVAPVRRSIHDLEVLPLLVPKFPHPLSEGIDVGSVEDGGSRLQHADPVDPPCRLRPGDERCDEQHKGDNGGGAQRAFCASIMSPQMASLGRTNAIAPSAS